MTEHQLGDHAMAADDPMAAVLNDVWQETIDATANLACTISLEVTE